jgi:hypothetical protein
MPQKRNLYRSTSPESNDSKSQKFAAKGKNRSGTHISSDGKLSPEQERVRNLNTGFDHEMQKLARPVEKRFDLIVDNVPYSIRATPVTFNDEIRYEIKINGGNEYIFTWDPEMLQLRAIDDESSALPDTVEEAISQYLQLRQ